MIWIDISIKCPQITQKKIKELKTILNIIIINIIIPWLNSPMEDKSYQTPADQVYISEGRGDTDCMIILRLPRRMIIQSVFG